MDGTSAANRFFNDCDPDKLLESLRKVLNQEPEELKAFIYNLYYDPLVKLLYSIWGKYLNPEVTVTPAAPESGKSTATAA